MRRLRILQAMLLMCIFSCAAAAQQPTPPSQQQQQQAEEERRREAERAAREKERQEQLKKESADRLEEFKRLRPPTPAERAAMHKRMFPDFVRNVRKFDDASRQLAAYGTQANLDRSIEKAVGKKAKSVEDRIGDIMDYILDGESPPEPPSETYSSRPLAERIQLFDAMSSRVTEQIQSSIAKQKAFVVDAKAYTRMLQDLQSLKLLTRSMRQ